LKLKIYFEDLNYERIKEEKDIEVKLYNHFCTFVQTTITL